MQGDWDNNQTNYQDMISDMSGNPDADRKFTLENLKRKAAQNIAELFNNAAFIDDLKRIHLSTPVYTGEYALIKEGQTQILEFLKNYHKTIKEE